MTGERIFDAFLRQAAANPEKIAITSSTATLTYGELDQMSARLGARLISAGLGIGDRIAIRARRSSDYICDILAVLRIGATMIPLDSEYPQERLRKMTEVSRPQALLLPDAGESPGWARDIPLLIGGADSAIVLNDSIVPSRLAAGDANAPAYIMFTSGTTGRPKAVITSHAPVLNFLEWQRETFCFRAEDRFTNLCGIASPGCFTFRCFCCPGHRFSSISSTCRWLSFLRDLAFARGARKSYWVPCWQAYRSGSFGKSSGPRGAGRNSDGRCVAHVAQRPDGISSARSIPPLRRIPAGPALSRAPMYRPSQPPQAPSRRCRR